MGLIELKSWKHFQMMILYSDIQQFCDRYGFPLTKTSILLYLQTTYLKYTKQAKSYGKIGFTVKADYCCGFKMSLDISLSSIIMTMTDSSFKNIIDVLALLTGNHLLIKNHDKIIYIHDYILVSILRNILFIE